MIARAATRPDWAIGFEDEPWWSRGAQPAGPTWSAGDPLRLVEPTVAADDPDPKALACSGVLVRQATTASDAVWRRCVAGRPLSVLTAPFLPWTGARQEAAGGTTLVVVWDNAGWHGSKAVRRWLRAHNQQVHRAGGVRVIPCGLPTKSPWRHPIAPTWVPGTRRIVEPARLLTAEELEDRVCVALRCPRADHLVIPQEVS